MNKTHVAVLLLSLSSLFTTWIGVALALRLRGNAQAVATGIGFSVGIMLLVSLVELVPQSLALVGARTTVTSFGLGVALLWAAHWLIPHTHLIEEKGLAARALARSVYLVVLGLVLHDVPEGFAMAHAYITAPSLGLLVALAIALHNIPEEFAMSMSAVLVRRKRFLYGAALLSALAEPLGAVIGLLAAGYAPGLNAHFMAFAAGAMCFVSLHELIPMAVRYRHLRLFALGMVASVAVHALLAWLTGQAF